MLLRKRSAPRASPGSFLHKLLRMLKGLFLFFLCFSSLAWGRPLEWFEQAQRLTGESDFVREKALQSLKQQKNLVETLRKEIHGEKKGLALDVIATLHLSELVPDLLADAEADETGQSYLTLNSLITNENRKDITGLYRKRLLCSPVCAPSGAAQVILLETLGRLNEDFSISEMERLVQSPSYETREAALEYIRTSYLQRRLKKHLALVRKAMRLQPFQLRLRALSFVSEMEPLDQKRFRAQLDCEDENKVVKDFCENLRGVSR